MPFDAGREPVWGREQGASDRRPILDTKTKLAGIGPASRMENDEPENVQSLDAARMATLEVSLVLSISW